MNTPAQPELVPGRAYRSRDLRPWSANPTRLARRLVDEGKLREAAHGLYYAPLLTRFGAAPASSEEILRAFLGGEPFLVTGPPYWNALRLGSTAMFAVTLVYNTWDSGEFQLGGRRETGIRVEVIARKSGGCGPRLRRGRGRDDDTSAGTAAHGMAAIEARALG